MMIILSRHIANIPCHTNWLIQNKKKRTHTNKQNKKNTVCLFNCIHRLYISKVFKKKHQIEVMVDSFLLLFGAIIIFTFFVRGTQPGSNVETFISGVMGFASEGTDFSKESMQSGSNASAREVTPVGSLICGLNMEPFFILSISNSMRSTIRRLTPNCCSMRIKT